MAEETKEVKKEEETIDLPVEKKEAIVEPTFQEEEKLDTSASPFVFDYANRRVRLIPSVNSYGFDIPQLTVKGDLAVRGTSYTEKLAVGNNDEVLTADSAVSSGVKWATASGIPSGVIVMWSGSIASIPSGWALCNGANGTPDLRNEFIVGAGSSYAVGSIGGSLTHTHTGRTAQDTSGDYRAWNAGPGSSGNNADASRGYHTQTFTTDLSNALPPYYALAYIMKL